MKVKYIVDYTLEYYNNDSVILISSYKYRHPKYVTITYKNIKLDWKLLEVYGDILNHIRFENKKNYEKNI